MTWLPFELELALRYLRPKRTSVSFITLISVLGVLLGVAVLIVVISVMTGFHQELQRKLFGFQSHLTVRRVAGTITEPAEIAQAVAALPSVLAVSPVIVGKALVEPGVKRTEVPMDGLVLIGVDTNSFLKVNPVPESVVHGRFYLGANKVGDPLVVAGVSLTEAGSLGVRTGDTLNIYTPGELKAMRDARKTGDDIGILSSQFEVGGVFDVGFKDFNGFLICSLAAAQELFAMPGQASAIFVRLDDPHKAAEVAAAVEAKLGPEYMVITWMQNNKELLGAVAVEKNVIQFLLFFIVLVAAFGVASSLIIFGVQKTRDIGLLKALGANNRQVGVVFLAQSMVVGVVGVGLGTGLGVLLVAYRNDVLEILRTRFGYQLFPKEIYHFSELPAALVTSDLLIICGGSLFISLMAGLLPALTAARLKPVQALHHD
ncbi:MAG: FtsX-like permease family protein [Pedosphaera sp.]|nr:FtsX-like permease family protein [Pedosphaera sp.]MSU44033.1 FtsX-like permease family protein [Pedosphaera sp.]